MTARSSLPLIVLLAGCLGLTGNSQAALLFTDNFSEPDITGSHNNFTALDNWDVTDGTVDAFVNGGFGLPCLSGGCLDMDGSTGNGGRIESKSAFNFLADVIYSLTIEYRGNARSGIDDISLGFANGGASTISNINSTNDWTTATLSVLSNSAWSSKLFVETSSNDNVGPLLSRVTLTNNLNGQVPEPTTLSLMALCLAGLGYRGLRAR